MLDKKKQFMKFENGTLFETYKGKKSNGYIGQYKTDGKTCSCSWFKNRMFCRHQVFFQDEHDLPIFR